MINQDDVIYFMLTDRFCNGDPNNDAPAQLGNPRHFHGGDFLGIVNRIPYLETLGVTAIWITPVYLNIADFGGSAGYHGYWAIDFEVVDPHLYSAQPGRVQGSREYLKDLVDACQAAGIKVILDIVVNHTAYHTPDYNAYPNKRIGDSWFNQGSGPVEGELSGLPDLDHDQVEVVDYFVNNILDWIEQTGIHGIRMDTVKHVEEKFWYFFKSCIKTRYPEVSLIGEVLEFDPQSIGRYQQKHDFDTLFDFPLCKTMKGSLVWDEPMTRLAKPRFGPGEVQGTLDDDKPYTNANRLVTLLDNHDLGSRITTEILDRVGHWDRDLARKILKLCLSLQFTTRGIPQIYYGTEIGMEGRGDPDNRRDMPWEIFGPDNRPKLEHFFERDVFDYLVSLIELRSNHPAIRYGYLITLYSDHFLYAFLREFRGDLVVVVINNGHEPMPAPLTIRIGDNSNVPPRVKTLLEGQTLTSHAGNVPDLTVTAGRVQLQLPGKTAGIFTSS